MAKENSQDQENKFITAAVKVAEAAEKARAPHDQAILAAVEKAGKMAKKGAEAVEEGAKKVGGAVKDTFETIGNGLGDSAYNFSDNNSLGRLITGKTGPSDEEIATAETKMKELMPAGDPKVGRVGFHTSTFTPICTSNAILRCSFGLTFGPLNVLPLKRTCIGDAAHCVATITDCLAQVNIPQFGLCFNILNPSVLAATTAATIAKGGVFTLVPMPCILAEAPTPWIPTSKNLCGQTPILTQPSCSLCWGLGTINILHCGQGIEPSILNYLCVPGDPMATIKGWVEGLVNLAGGVGGLVAAGKLAKNISTIRKTQIAVKTAQTAKNANRLATIVKNIERGGDVLDIANNLHDGVTKAMEGDAGGAAAAFTGAIITGGTRGRAEYLEHKAKTKPPSTAFTQAKENADSTLRKKNAAQAKFNEADANYIQVQTNEEVAKGFRDQSEKQLKASKEAQVTKQKELTEAKIQENSANTEVILAKTDRRIADTNLESAQKNQKNAKERVTNAQQKKQETAEKLKQAKERQAKVEADPNSTDLDKQQAKMDTDYAEWNDNRAQQDLAAKQQTSADAKKDVEAKEKAKKDADKNVVDKEADLKEKKKITENKQEEKKKADEQVEMDELFLHEDEDFVKTKTGEREQAWKDKQAIGEDLQKKDDAHKKANKDLQEVMKAEEAPSTSDKVISNAVGFGKKPTLQSEENIFNAFSDDDKKDIKSSSEANQEARFDKYLIGYENEG